MIEIVDTGTRSAHENMEIDAQMLGGLDPNGKMILHLYDWERPSLTYGYFIKPHQHLNIEALAKNGIDIGRRPTGGGIVFHLWDLAFSVLVPANHPGYHENTLDNYTYINSFVKSAMQKLLGKELNLLPDEPLAQNEASRHFCYAKPTKYDVMLGGKKLAGAAQRKKRNGYLHQGSISLIKPDEELLKSLLKTDLSEMMNELTFYVRGGKLNQMRAELRNELIRVIS